MHVNVHNFCSVILQQMFIELKKKCSLAQSAHSRLSNVCKKNTKLTYTASFVCVLLTMHTNLVFCGLYIIFFACFLFYFCDGLKNWEGKSKKLQKDIILHTLSPISL